MTRAVKIVDAAPGGRSPRIGGGHADRRAGPPSPSPVRIAALDGQAARFDGLRPREAPFEIVPPSQAPELVWDAATGDLLAGADVVAYRLDKVGACRARSTAPPRCVRSRALRRSRRKPMQVLPDDKLHRKDSKVTVEIGGVANRALILLNIAGDGTVQLLYPVGSDPKILRQADYRLPVRVREPFGSDLVVAITSEQPMPQLEQALRRSTSAAAPWRR